MRPLFDFLVASIFFVALAGMVVIPSPMEKIHGTKVRRGMNGGVEKHGGMKLGCQFQPGEKCGVLRANGRSRGGGRVEKGEAFRGER